MHPVFGVVILGATIAGRELAAVGAVVVLLILGAVFLMRRGR